MISSMMGRTLAANRLAFAFTAAVPRFAASGSRQSGFGMLRDHFPLVLRDGGEDVHRQLVGVRVVHGHELDAGFHKRGDKGKGYGTACQAWQ
jgi:hypothetical protein